MHHDDNQFLNRSVDRKYSKQRSRSVVYMGAQWLTNRLSCLFSKWSPVLFFNKFYKCRYVCFRIRLFNCCKKTRTAFHVCACACNLVSFEITIITILSIGPMISAPLVENRTVRPQFSACHRHDD